VSRFLAYRLVQSLVVLLAMSFATYVLIGLMPGDPIDMMFLADPGLTPEDVARLKAVYGLDRPLLARYLDWLLGAFQGEFGFSRLHARPVLELVWSRLGNTVLLMGGSLALAVAIAVPAGLWVARHAGGRIDALVNLVCFAGISVPTFWLGLLLILLFAVTLGWLPAGGIQTIGEGGIVDRLRHAALPMLTLTLATIGGHVRYIRAATVEALRQDYVRTAEAKGLTPRRVLWGHAFRNAAIPYVTILALDCGTLFSGALVTETIFAYPGMGKLLYDAILGNDYNLALVALLFGTGVTLASNLGADLAYARLDPRIRAA